MARVAVLTWDWREQPDLAALAKVLAQFGVGCRQVDTGTDEYALVLSDRGLTKDDARAAYEGRDAR